MITQADLDLRAKLRSWGPSTIEEIIAHASSELGMKEFEVRSMYPRLGTVACPGGRKAK